MNRWLSQLPTKPSLLSKVEKDLNGAIKAPLCPMKPKDAQKHGACNTHSVQCNKRIEFVEKAWKRTHSKLINLPNSATRIIALSSKQNAALMNEVKKETKSNNTNIVKIATLEAQNAGLLMEKNLLKSEVKKIKRRSPICKPN